MRGPSVSWLQQQTSSPTNINKNMSTVSCPPAAAAIRFGRLSLHPEFAAIKTPVCLQYTQLGSVPHISWDLVCHLRDDNAPVLTSISKTIPMKQQMQSLKIGMHEFCRIPETRAIFMSNNDSLSRIEAGANRKSGIAYRRSSGIQHINGMEYLQLVRCSKVQAFQSLSDCDTPKSAPKKRIEHSVKRSLSYLSELKYMLEDDKTIPAQYVFGSITGGYDLKSRMICLKDMSEFEVDGFVVEGFHEYDPQQQKIDDDALPILEQVIQQLPPNSPVALFGSLSPECMLQLMKLGVSIFDSSFATSLTEQGKALLLHLSDEGSDMSVRSETLDLRDAGFKNDMNTISSDCDCYCCRKSFTRAYINHLLVTKEMLSYVLLNFHNLYTMYHFFRCIHGNDT